MPASPAVLLELTGAPRVRAAGRAFELAPHDAWLLAWLALEGPTPRERLAQLLWPASDAVAARNALRQRLFRLKRQLGCDAVQGSALLTLADGVAHDLGGGDAREPGRPVGDGPGLLAGLVAGVSPALDDWLAGRRAAAQTRAHAAGQAQADAFEAAGDLGAALPLAKALAEAEPLSEAAHRRVMRLHYLRGDRAAALLAFDRCEQVLKHEIGTAPGRLTLDLLATVERSGSLAGAAALRTAVPVAVLRPPRLVGREAEVAALGRGLAAGHVVVLIGEAGMGKSRLLQALAADAAATRVHASGRPGDTLVPYATAARALRQLIDLEPAAADPALRRALAPLLPEWLPPEASVTTAAPALQPPLAQPVLALLQRLALRLDMLALDDLHFADDATLELLQTLLAAPRAAGAPPLRWCLGARPAAAGSRLAGLLDALATAGPHTRLSLQPLNEAQLAELVDSLALPGVAGAAVAPTLHQRTGGNPLFALETLKLAWQDGTLAGSGGGEAAPGSDAVAAGLPRPDTLAQLIGQQVARLSPAALQLARVAAVAGVDFSLPLAEALLGRNVLEMADAWAELEARQVLRGDAFAHDLIHDAVLQGLPEIIARHLHGQTAERLEAAAGEPARIAAHWEAAGQRARALPALRAAAERAHGALREGERIALLLRAADIAEAAERRDEAFELIRSALAGHMNTIRQADGLPLLARLQALARTPLQHARAAGDRAWYVTVLGDFGTAQTLGEQALAQALALGDAGLESSVRQRLGTALGMLGRFSLAVPQMRAAERWMQDHAAADEQSEFQGNLAVLLDNLGRPAEAQAHHLRALASSAAQGDHAQQATQRANYAGSRLDAGDLAGAREQAAQAQLIVTTYEMAGASAGFVATLQAQCERASGHYRPALEWCERAEIILARRNPARLPVAQLHAAHVWLDLGQHARALQLLAGPGLDTARALPPRYAVRWLVLLARVQRRLHRPTAPLLAEALALAPDEGWPELRLIVRTEQALALSPTAALGELQEVAAQAQALRLHGAELAALLHAGWLAAQHAPALAGPLAHAALDLSARAEALQADRALRWLGPAAALAAAGDGPAAAGHVEAGRAWLRSTAAVHVESAFVDSFLHRHPVNAALAAWHLPPPGP